MSLRFTTLHYTTLHYTTLHYTTLQLQLHNYTPLHSTTLNYTTLHYITLHCTTFHYTSLHYTTLHYTTTRNPAHRRPWLKMKIEYHPALIFCAFVRGFLKFQVYTLFVAEFHWKVSYMAFSPQRTDNFNAFLKWRNYFVYARICFFFSSSDSINPAAGGLPSVPKIRSSVASTYVGKVHER